MAPAELKLLVVSPSIKNWPLLIGLGLVVTITGILGLILLILNFQTALLIASLGVALTVWPALSAANTEYLVTHARIVRREGIFGKKETDLPITGIQEIRISRTSLQQSLGIGDLELVSQQGTLRLDGVEDPELIREKIQTLA